MATTQGIDIRGPLEARHREILSPEALDFLADLHRTFEPRRRELLTRRMERQRRVSEGADLDFDAETVTIRERDWQTAPPPADILDRRVEITGPVDRKMVINALNSGAKVFMADFEDANAPSWSNNLDGHGNLIDAIEGTIEFTNPDGREYRLNDHPAYLMVRPRGWHLHEKHLLIDGEPIAGGLFDFGLYVFHNAERRRSKGLSTCFYLPKLESHQEAAFWNDVFSHAEERLGLDTGALRATVLIETIWAAFQMDEILYALREHSLGLNAGRWDYIFSFIKTFRTRADKLLPDRAQVTMTVPFMRAYTELLVKICHRRATFAMGGMAAFIPSRRDPDVNRAALEQVKADKDREAAAGFDGTWVAHPDLVETAMASFDAVLGHRPNQIERRRDEVDSTAAQLTDPEVSEGRISEDGLRTNVSVGIQYVESWLRGNGAAAINNLMEDAATAEISRTQVWQWVHHEASLDDGTPVTPDLVRRIEDEELAKLRERYGEEVWAQARFADARTVFDEVALADDFVPFLTIPAYRFLD